MKLKPNKLVHYLNAVVICTCTMIAIDSHTVLNLYSLNGVPSNPGTQTIYNCSSVYFDLAFLLVIVLAYLSYKFSKCLRNFPFARNTS